MGEGEGHLQLLAPSKSIENNCPFGKSCIKMNTLIVLVQCYYTMLWKEEEGI